MANPLGNNASALDFLLLLTTPCHKRYNCTVPCLTSLKRSQQASTRPCRPHLGLTS
jgi:hypothetical protein